MSEIRAVAPDADETAPEADALREEIKKLTLAQKKLARELEREKLLNERNRLSAIARTNLEKIVAAEKTNLERYMNLLLANSRDLILLFDKEGLLQFASDSFLEATEVQSQGVLRGKSYHDILEPIVRKEFLQEIDRFFFASLQEKHIAAAEQYIAFARLGLRHYHIQITPMLDDEDQVDGAMMFFYDTTEIERAKEAAEEANRAKSAFLATISHEIRTPLNAIIGLAQIQLQKAIPEDTHADLEKIYNSGTSLLAIINDILDISKIETGNFELIPVEYDIPSLVNDTALLNIVRIGSKPIEFQIDIDPEMPAIFFGDELRVKQVMNNILSNAFKYTREGRVKLSIGFEKPSPSQETPPPASDSSVPPDSERVRLVFKVRDTGIGIKKEDIGKLFSEYTQLDTKANRKIEGTGLGLSITKKLVTLMDGSVTAESEYGIGSEFTVKIMQWAVGGRKIGAQVAQSLKTFNYFTERRERTKNLVHVNMSYGKVLVVDDVQTNLDVARGLMLPYGLTIDCVSSGPAAIEKIRHGRERYDAVFMDHMMPGMDGVEATRIIREEIGTVYAKNVPIVALTANAISGNEEMFLSKGFNSFLSKPIDVMRLDAILRQFVRDKQSEETRAAAEKAAEEATALAAKNALFEQEDPNAAAAKVLSTVFVENIDIKKGVAHFGGENTYLTILRSYFQHTPKLLEKMSAPAPDALKEYAVTVHGLKSASYGIFAHEVGRQAEALEMLAKAGDYESVSVKNPAFLKAASELLTTIDEILRAISYLTNEGCKEKADSIDTHLLDALLNAAEHFKSAELERTMGALERYSYKEKSDNELISWLREQINNLEYDAVCEKLKTLAGGAA